MITLFVEQGNEGVCCVKIKLYCMNDPRICDMTSQDVSDVMMGKLCYIQ